MKDNGNLLSETRPVYDSISMLLPMTPGSTEQGFNIIKQELDQFKGLIDCFDSKWKLYLLYCFEQKNSIKYLEIRRLIPEITYRTLSATLAFFLERGLIEKKLSSGIARGFEFAITEEGKACFPVIMYMIKWAKGQQ